MHVLARYVSLTLVGLVILTLFGVSLRDARDVDPASAMQASHVSASDQTPTEDSAGARPNVVLILTDDMRADDLEHMPLTRAAIGGAGIEYTNAISPHPLCCPARAELVTGQYAQNNGVQHNNGEHGGFQALDPEQQLSTWFSEAGYQTGFVGKFLNGYSADAVQPSGWDRWDALLPRVYNYSDFTFDNDGSPESFTDSYVTDAIGERTNDLVRRFAAEDEPFFVYSWHLAPHYRLSQGQKLPPLVAERDRGKFTGLSSPSIADPAFNEEEISDQPAQLRDRRKVSVDKVNEEYRARIGSLQAVDRAVGSLVTTLEEVGELDNTYIVFSSDNGYSMGEHRLIGKNILTSQALRVPLLVRGPDVSPGSTSDLPVSLVDLPATFVAAGGVKPTWVLDGVPLQTSMAGQTQAFRTTTLIQTGSNDEDGWALRGAHTQRYVYGRDGDEGVLYDLQVDPHALENVFGDPRYEAVQEALDQRRATLMTCAGWTCNQDFGPLPEPEPEPAQKRTSGDRSFRSRH